MAAITASLERSLQSFSLNHRSTTTAAAAGEESTNSSDATLELDSNITLPYYWEQCLDLKTGEMYYINWRTGMKSKEDPRFSGYFYSDEEEEDDDEESSYADSESSSAESSPAASSSEKQKENDEDEDEDEGESRVGGHVLVVAGCKGCFMYFMVPKQVEDCPKCCGQLLHFDRSDDN
ncbi:hypothetical protein L1987_79431 [Smallanthus sonchifolius]|uniref:Uncharacterized protein n=1 Tax=Smallanthus sonchifolius TaxID=185202 RepID=A0ACB8ZFS4_9ASTR|nr:hypothetical protein L1987_79431 [Smallanthus sonchifolius]